MTQTSDGKLDEILLIIDKHRGRILEVRKLYEKDDIQYKQYSNILKLLNGLKREVCDVFDTDQFALGL